MNIKKVYFCFVLFFLVTSSVLWAQEIPRVNHWTIGAQAYTFRLFTFEETLQKLNELGLSRVEIYPGQVLSKNSVLTTHFKSGKDNLETMKDLLSQYDITPYAYGVVKANSEKEWEAVFVFVKALGIDIINAEPLLEHLDILEKLCEKYQIKIALHNHAVPSTYWHPKMIVEVLKDRSQLMGVCGDVGHWARSGLDPLECIDIIGDRIIGFHFKDLNGLGDKKAHDVPWGTGYCNLSGVLNELKRRNFNGYFSVEYEYNWNNSLPEIAESLAYFDRF